MFRKVDKKPAAYMLQKFLKNIPRKGIVNALTFKIMALLSETTQTLSCESLFTWSFRHSGPYTTQVTQALTNERTIRFHVTLKHTVSERAYSMTIPFKFWVIKIKHFK